MKINFVTEPAKNKWILRRWCEEWSKYIPDSEITSLPMSYADAHIYVNYALFKQTNAIDIAYFTHKEKTPPLSGIFEMVAEQADWCFGQSDYTMRMLEPHTTKATKIRPGVHDIFIQDRPLRIGVVGREYDSGRKRTDWISELRSAVPNSEILYTDGKIPFEEMPKFYESIDYLLITAEIEGGPMPVVEALATYKPVIAPVGVGWCDEFSCIRYHSLADLREVLYNLVPDYRQWEKSAQQMVEIVNKLLV